MKDYIGTKPLKAPMTRGDYNAHRGWTPPEGEEQNVAGYHVVYSDGYQSWSPAPQFEEAYQPLDAMSFGHALVMLKAGHKVARRGWNGKGMWLILVPGTPQVEPREGSPYAKAGIEVCDILPHVDMWTVNADGRRAMLPGWLASQSDMLADDWEVVA